jgi:hypothetical protein
MNRLIRDIRVVVAPALLASLIAACSGTVEAHHSCGDRPCKEKPKSSMAAEVAAPLPPPLPVPVVPPVRDAGVDRPAFKPDGGRTVVPPPNLACQDLMRCCGRVRNTVERAACVAMSSQGEPGTCANAVIAYQMVGGCSHSEFERPDIFDGSYNPNPAMNCAYLMDACTYDPSQCAAAYDCQGADVPGSSGYDDPCDYAGDPYCCRYPDSLECMPSSDPCATADDAYCCRNPTSRDCTDTPSTDPCEYDPNPYCCRTPWASGCWGE